MTGISISELFAAPAGREPREPLFLVEARARGVAHDVSFGPVSGRAVQAGPQGRPPAEAGPSRPPAPAPEPPPPPPAPPVPSPGAVEFAERVAAAVSALRLTGERLAEQARSDALELALLLARRIVEGELQTNVEPLFGIVRSVVRRVGESRRATVRLSPGDAARVEQGGHGQLFSGISIGQVDVVADPSLSPGDCMVDADFGTVDARLDTRLDELRRLLDEAAAGGER
jgi:flagellar assembly protein FliH